MLYLKNFGIIVPQPFMKERVLIKYFNNVMLVDDNFIDNFVHKKLLGSIKIANQFHEFTKPAEAINYLKLFNGFSDEPNKNFVDLIFIDINMPGMNGWEFLEELKMMCKNIKPQTTIIVLSSSTNKEDEEKAQNELFVSGYIQKPLTLEKLTACFQGIY